MKVINNVFADFKNELKSVDIQMLFNQARKEYNQSPAISGSDLLILLKVQCLIFHTLEKVTELHHLISNKSLPKICNLLASKSKASLPDLNLAEIHLINCVDTLHSPMASIVIILFVLGDIESDVAVDALAEAYFYDNIYREQGFDIQYTKQPFILKSFETDTFSIITSLFFQKCFKEFDCMTPSNDFLDLLGTGAFQGVPYESYLRSVLESENSYVYEHKLKKCKQEYLENFESEYYIPLSRLTKRSD
jgi:hypothetical protein